MRIIVEAFKDALELGLAKNGQVVVSHSHQLHLNNTVSTLRLIAYDSNLRVRLAHRQGDRELPRR